MNSNSPKICVCNESDNARDCTLLHNYLDRKTILPRFSHSKPNTCGASSPLRHYTLRAVYRSVDKHSLGSRRHVRSFGKVTDRVRCHCRKIIT